MSVRNLSCLVKPSTVALIGASERPCTVGEVLTRNLLGAGFGGEIYLVNPGYEYLAGVKCYPNATSLPKAPDLAVIATPPESVPELIRELAGIGAKAAVVITAGFGEGGNERGKQLCSEMLDAARPSLLRVVGPNCLGIMAPRIGLNASMAHIAKPAPGGIAFVAQSGAVQTSLLDWAAARGIGFSSFISLGDMADVDFGDMLDYLASDFHTRAILLYMETVVHARKFMSAARAAARAKPVIVFKAGRSVEGAAAAARHTGSVAGEDAVCDAAFRRAGMLRVFEMQALFDAVETLAVGRGPIRGDRLAILTNGGGVGVIATDALIERGGRLAELSPGTMERLDEVLPATWSRGNPVDIVSDATAQRYSEALEAILQDKGVDAVLALNCPIAVVSGADSASAVIKAYEERPTSPKAPTLLTSWLGEQTASEARRMFAKHRIPTYKTPTDAVRAFMHMVNYARNQEMLMETPASISEAFSPDLEAALRVVEDALAEDRHRLSRSEVGSILRAYRIPADFSLLGSEPGEEAVQREEAVSNAVAPLAQSFSEERENDATASATRLPAKAEPSPGHPSAQQLMIRITVDPLFGPVITFGHGGEAADEIQDTALALPPLNVHLARELISRTRIHRRLKGMTGILPANIEAVALTLVKLSQLICDIAEITDIEINPLVVDDLRATVAAASMCVARSSVSASERLAIRPYPKELEDMVTLRDGSSLLLRPIMPEDEPGFSVMVDSLTPEERRMRFLHPVQTLTHNEAARLTQIDYDREMALVLAGNSLSGGQDLELYGSVRIIADPDNEHAEYAILVHKSMAGKGLGRILMQHIIDYARSRGIKEIFGQVICENVPMLRLCGKLGFTTKRDPDDPGTVIVSLLL